MPNYKVYNETPLLARPPVGTFKTNSQTLAFTHVAVWTPASGKKVRLYGAIVSAAGLTTISISFGTTNVITSLFLGVNTTVVFDLPLPLEGAVNQSVTWSGTGIAAANITLIGEEV